MFRWETIDSKVKKNKQDVFHCFPVTANQKRMEPGSKKTNGLADASHPTWVLSVISKLLRYV